MNANEMIDRYVHAVGQHLPSKMRGDIEQELRSLLQDTLDEQTPPGEKPTVDDVAELLKQFGKPEEMAANYRPKQALIGEALFPTYKQVLTIVLTVMSGFHFVLFLIMLLTKGVDDLAGIMSGLFSSLIEMGFFAAGAVTVVFAILERVDGVSAEVEKNSAEWNPLNLPPLKDPNRIDKGELITRIVFAFIFISALNFSFDAIGVINIRGDDYAYTIVGLLSEEFRNLVPWLTASWTVSVLLDLVVLLSGRWTLPTRWLQIGEQLFSLFVLYLVLSSQAIWIIPIATIITKGIIAIVMIVELFEVLRNLYRLVSPKWTSPEAVFQSNLA